VPASLLLPIASVNWCRPSDHEAALCHNLSYKLVGRLADLFPDSEHVRNVNLHEADDRTIWEYARANGLAIVSKDTVYPGVAPGEGHDLTHAHWAKAASTCGSQNVIAMVR
jgi:Domain of unknown function (DUF5615)